MKARPGSRPESKIQKVYCRRAKELPILCHDKESSKDHRQPNRTLLSSDSSPLTIIRKTANWAAFLYCFLKIPELNSSFRKEVRQKMIRGIESILLFSENAKKL